MNRRSHICEWYVLTAYGERFILFSFSDTIRILFEYIFENHIGIHPIPLHDDVYDGESICILTLLWKRKSKISYPVLDMNNYFNINKSCKKTTNFACRNKIKEGSIPECQ